jgi:hypothetical protein
MFLYLRFSSSSPPSSSDDHDEIKSKEKITSLAADRITEFLSMASRDTKNIKRGVDVMMLAFIFELVKRLHLAAQGQGQVNPKEVSIVIRFTESLCAFSFMHASGETGSFLI